MNGEWRNTNEGIALFGILGCRRQLWTNEQGHPFGVDLCPVTPLTNMKLLHGHKTKSRSFLMLPHYGIRLSHECIMQRSKWHFP